MLLKRVALERIQATRLRPVLDACRCPRIAAHFRATCISERGKARGPKTKEARRDRRASYGAEVEARRRHDPGVWIDSKSSQQRPARRLTNL
ncbi:hypothetical protein MPLDJ20_320039 [Mesorhizobium plurifarium]|uniref:Uncharacterized protein n=1 Tax=Mesorhizobium plurifarium TaxID=69974 RepID=A0A090FHN1_MESPL|nr:hypothetical protein MPLDJ20_320039 [Mesorhizobium plurifarium]